MNKITYTYLLLLVFLPMVLHAQQSAHNGAPKYAPQDGQKLLVIGQDLGAVGGLDGYSDGYVDHLGQVPSGVTTYTGFPGLTGLSSKANWGSGDVHAQAYIDDSNFDKSFIVIGLHLVDQLGSIIGGFSDHLIEDLGEWIMAQERPVFLRIGYEFDGSWNHYDPEQYKQAWIHIVEYFDTLGVRNVAYVWQSYGGNTGDIEKWYPGDVYVNWVGYSQFDQNDPGANMIAFAKSHNKPLMIAEATPKRDLMFGDGAAHWTAWYDPLFTKISSHDEIKALAYINVDWESQPMWQTGGWGDSRVQVNEEVERNWRSEIQKDQWILGSDSLFEELDYTLWQDSVTTVVDPSLQREERQVDIISNGDLLLIRSGNKLPMEGIRLSDLSGRLKWMSIETAMSYEIPHHQIRKPEVLLVQVKIQGVNIQKKVVLLH